MIHCKEIDDYIAYCHKFPDEINEDRKKLIQNVALPTLKRSDIFFDEEMFHKCISYCESNYYPLFPYQKFVYAFVFMYIEDTPLFSTFFIMMGRGNGKDGFIMPLVNFLQTPIYGVKNYHIDIIANNETQAKDSFLVVYDMLKEKANKFKNKFYVSLEKVQNFATNSILRYNTSNAKTKDGKKGGCLVFNEYHAYETSEQINVFTSQRGKIRHPRTIIITTNGYVRGGPLDEMLDVCHGILETGENEIGYFPFICRIDDIREMDNPDKWIKANPSLPYRPILHQEIKQAYLEMQKFPSKRAEFITKRMNLPESQQESPVANWDDILAASYQDIVNKILRETPNLTGKNAIIGIDYADVRDFASAGILFKVGEEYIWRQKTWACENGPFFHDIKFPLKSNYGLLGFQDYEIVTQKSIPISAIVDWCMEQMQQFNILKIVCDTYRFTLLRNVFEQHGIDVEDIRRNPYGLVRMIRKTDSVYALVAPVVEMLFTNGNINYGDSAIMRWYTNNTGTSRDKYGNTTFIKIEPKLRKNDGFSAFVMAMQARELLEETILVI